MISTIAFYVFLIGCVVTIMCVMFYGIFGLNVAETKKEKVFCILPMVLSILITISSAVVHFTNSNYFDIVHNAQRIGESKIYMEMDTKKIFTIKKETDTIKEKYYKVYLDIDTLDKKDGVKND